VIVVAAAAWALARQQNEAGPAPEGGADTSPGGGSPPYGHSYSNGYANGAAPGAGPPPQPQQPPPRAAYPNGSAGAAGAERPKPTWQRTNPASGPNASANANNTAGGGAKGAWERAREETKRKEQERKAKEAEQKRKEDMDKRLREAREKEVRERAEREKRTKEQREQDQKEREMREGRSAGSSYAYSAMGEKTNPWPQGRPPVPRSQPNSPTKRPPAPTAKTYRGTDDDEYSYRPYDTPKKPAHKQAPSIYSESSYAPSQSTSRTTPPPSHRGPYHTKDPDKIVIKAVYSFNNSFLKTPTSQLISGNGSVTDGLILRITTEGLFIDDDVRGVPQREWDVKAWTMKLVEVWCPSFRYHLDASASARVASAPASASTTAARLSMRRLWGLDSSKAKAAPSSEELDAFLTNFLQICRDTCNSTAASASASDTSSLYSATSYASSQTKSSAYTESTTSASSPLSSKDSNIKTKRSPTDKSSPRFQTGENKAAGLHVLRASIRDQDGKRYVFIISEDESWKVAVGLQRLRKGTQVRALGLSGMTVGDARGTLESLGWI